MFKDQASEPWGQVDLGFSRVEHGTAFLSSWCLVLMMLALRFVPPHWAKCWWGTMELKANSLQGLKLHMWVNWRQFSFIHEIYSWQILLYIKLCWMLCKHAFINTLFIHQVFMVSTLISYSQAKEAKTHRQSYPNDSHQEKGRHNIWSRCTWPWAMFFQYFMRSPIEKVP